MTYDELTARGWESVPHGPQGTLWFPPFPYPRSWPALRTTEAAAVEAWKDAAVRAEREACAEAAEECGRAAMTCKDAAYAIRRRTP